MKKKPFKAILFIALVACGLSMTMCRNADKIVSYRNDADGVTFVLGKGSMKIKICRNDIVEVKYSTLPVFQAASSLVVTNPWAGSPEFTVRREGNDIMINTSRLIIKVNRETSSITYCDKNNIAILSEDSPGGRKMTADTVAGISTYRCETQFLSPADEALFGLGCHPEDSLAMNYKGRNQSMAIKYMTGAIPVLLSNKGYGLMWDNYSASAFYGAEAGNTKFRYESESGKMVDYYFFFGPDFDHIISLYREATGQAPMFPKWSFGLFQSQDRYKSQAEVLSVKDNYRKNNIPVDCIVQDWFYWEPDVIGSHVINPSRYPDPKAMVDELHKANIHAMISIWPVFAKGTPNYDELKNAGGLVDITWDNVMTHTFDSYYDAHSVKARDIYWKQANDHLISRYGWDAWWVDQCEPDNGALLDARRRALFALGRGIDYFNTYSLMHTTGLYSNWRKDIQGKRAFFLVRQAFAGQQRNSATLWSSDITCTFKAFKIQIPQGINACASGIPYWTSDIGGYHLNWSAPEWSAPANRELFTRWFQFGAFCPVFRIHGKGERALFSQNWDQNTKAVLLKFDNLRYRLMPYIYSLSWKVTSGSYTVMRALAFDFRTDTAINNIRDQYMFGPAFLVNPVAEQMYSNGKTSGTRPVYLPKAAGWFDFWTGRTLNGGQTIDAPAPIDILPLFVRAGSIVPMGPFLQFATEKPADPLEVRIYPGADGEFTLYEDEADNYNYEKGQYALIGFAWDDAHKTLTISDRRGEFPGMLKERIINVVLVSENHGTGLEICTKPDKTTKYNGEKLEIKF
ncbi:MAG: TIM-barrel domain-containing protein [Bacteroidales bacterium]